MDIMLDVETLGNEGKFLVLSVAMIPFKLGNIERTAKLLDENQHFYEKVDFADSILAGFEIDPDTVDWWRKQDPSVFRAQFTNALLIDDFCKKLNDYITSLSEKYNRKNFDFYTTAKLDYSAVANLFRAQTLTKYKNPVNYRFQFCARTIRNEAIKKAKRNNFNFRSYTAENNHNALADCINQIHLVNEEYNYLFGV